MGLFFTIVTLGLASPLPKHLSQRAGRGGRQPARRAHGRQRAADRQPVLGVPRVQPDPGTPRADGRAQAPAARPGRLHHRPVVLPQADRAAVRERPASGLHLRRHRHGDRDHRLRRPRPALHAHSGAPGRRTGRGRSWQAGGLMGLEPLATDGQDAADTIGLGAVSGNGHPDRNRQGARDGGRSTNGMRPANGKRPGDEGHAANGQGANGTPRRRPPARMRNPAHRGERREPVKAMARARSAQETGGRAGGSADAERAPGGSADAEHSAGAEHVAGRSAGAQHGRPAAGAGGCSGLARRRSAWAYPNGRCATTSG